MLTAAPPSERHPSPGPTESPASAAVRAPARTARAWWGDAAGAAAIASLVIVTGLWLANRGLQGLGGWAGGLTSIGRLSGLWSADLLILQVLLLARIPWVERTYGQDRLARWHRVVGCTSFDLLLVHVVLITVGYAAGAHLGIVAQAWELVTDEPGMLLATAALGLLVMVVVTSVKAARRRLRYESWHLLHLYAYLGVGLALPHEVWTGTDFVGSAAARLYWWTIYGGTMTAVVVFRLGVPLWRSWRHRLVVDTVVAEGPGVISVHLRGRHLDRLGVRAGHFFLWRFLDGPGWARAHPYSLSAAPTANRLRITVKDLGDDSRWLASVRPGTKVVVEGPYGRLTGEARRARGLTLIGSGIGITPLRALLEELDDAGADAVVIYRARSVEDLVLRHELDAIGQRRGARIVHLPGSRRAPGSWLPVGTPALTDAAALLRCSPGVAAHDVYVCGPDPWMDAVADAARALGVPDDRLHLERFSW